MSRDDELVVEVPARLLHTLEALAGGYTMSNGRWLNPHMARMEAQSILYDAGYESWDDEPLPGAFDWKV